MHAEREREREREREKGGQRGRKRLSSSHRGLFDAELGAAGV
jgi:hypothetical protein